MFKKLLCALLTVLLLGCESMSGGTFPSLSFSPLGSGAQPETPKTPINRDITNFSRSMSCMQGLLIAYGYDSTRPLVVHVVNPASRYERGAENGNVWSELPQRLAGQVKGSLLQLSPSVQLYEPLGDEIDPDRYEYALVVEPDRIDRGVIGASRNEQAAFDIRNLGLSASRGEEFGVTSIALTARTLQSNALSSPLSLHVQLQANALWRTKDQHVGLSILGGSVGRSVNATLVEGPGAVTKLMAQHIAFTVAARHFMVPGWRCLDPGAEPDAEWLAIWSSRVRVKSDVELVARTQELLDVAGARVQITGRMDEATAKALKGKVSVPTPTPGTPVRRDILERIFFDIYTTLPTDMSIVRVGAAYVRNPANRLQGSLYLDVRGVNVGLKLDGKPVDVLPCGVTEIKAPVGDHIVQISKDVAPPTNKKQPAANAPTAQPVAMRVAFSLDAPQHHTIEPQKGAATQTCKKQVAAR